MNTPDSSGLNGSPSGIVVPPVAAGAVDAGSAVGRWVGLGRGPEPPICQLIARNWSKISTIACCVNVQSSLRPARYLPSADSGAACLMMTHTSRHVTRPVPSPTHRRRHPLLINSSSTSSRHSGSSSKSTMAIIPPWNHPRFPSTRWRNVQSRARTGPSRAHSLLSAVRFP